MKYHICMVTQMIKNLSLTDRAFLRLSYSCRYATEASGDSVP